MKYKVEINYTSFTFDDGSTAISFAEIAKASAEDEVRVNIKLEGEEE